MPALAARCPRSGPFAGVPFLIKDLGQHLAGVPTGSGNRSLARFPRPETSTVVRRWLDAGLVVFGRTATPEFGARAITEPVAGARATTLGPVTEARWQLRRVRGGLRGRHRPRSRAGTTAGAPSGFRLRPVGCGLLGLKPRRGVVPSGAAVDEVFHGAAVQGVLSRTVRDSAAMLDVRAGSAPEGPYRVAPAERPYADADAVVDPRPLRIGLSTVFSLGGPVDPQAATAVRDAGELLTGLGHVVEESAPAIDGQRLATDFLTTWFTMVAAEVTAARKFTGCAEDDFEQRSGQQS